MFICSNVKNLRNIYAFFDSVFCLFVFISRFKHGIPLEGSKTDIYRDVSWVMIAKTNISYAPLRMSENWYIGVSYPIMIIYCLIYVWLSKVTASGRQTERWLIHIRESFFLKHYSLMWMMFLYIFVAFASIRMCYCLDK